MVKCKDISLLQNQQNPNVDGCAPSNVQRLIPVCSTTLNYWYSAHLCAPCKQERTYKYPYRLRCHIASEMLTYCHASDYSCSRLIPCEDRALTIRGFPALHHTQRDVKYFYKRRTLRVSESNQTCLNCRAWAKSRPQSGINRVQITDDTGLDRFTQRMHHISLFSLRRHR